MVKPSDAIKYNTGLKRDVAAVQNYGGGVSSQNRDRFSGLPNRSTGANIPDSGTRQLSGREQQAFASDVFSPERESFPWFQSEPAAGTNIPSEPLRLSDEIAKWLDRTEGQRSNPTPIADISDAGALQLSGREQQAFASDIWSPERESFQGLSSGSTASSSTDESRLTPSEVTDPRSKTQSAMDDYKSRIEQFFGFGLPTDTNQPGDNGEGLVGPDNPASDENGEPEYGGPTDVANPDLEAESPETETGREVVDLQPWSPMMLPSARSLDELQQQAFENLFGSGGKYAGLRYTGIYDLMASGRKDLWSEWAREAERLATEKYGDPSMWHRSWYATYGPDSQYGLISDDWDTFDESGMSDPMLDAVWSGLMKQRPGAYDVIADPSQWANEIGVDPSTRMDDWVDFVVKYDYNRWGFKSPQEFYEYLKTNPEGLDQLVAQYQLQAMRQAYSLDEYSNTPYSTWSRGMDEYTNADEWRYPWTEENWDIQRWIQGQSPLGSSSSGETLPAPGTLDISQTTATNSPVSTGSAPISVTNAPVSSDLSSYDNLTNETTNPGPVSVTSALEDVPETGFTTYYDLEPQEDDSWLKAALLSMMSKDMKYLHQWSDRKKQRETQAARGDTNG